jgi:hypothetical protein
MYAEITPHHLAALSVRRAADALEQTEADPTTWSFVILDLHRALYCALIPALSRRVPVFSLLCCAEEGGQGTQVSRSVVGNVGRHYVRVGGQCHSL